ncbi:Protein deglycase DJ-1zDJ-1 [Polyrhizophydium stewartii]|uniref:D-lactate dehydratase n=1 Tax=Polyrhizophydium stewartii TaxID=2732419 RepID=A0ABR4MXJ6_9FUNG
MVSAHKVLVLVADGSEEMETVISVDVLRRAGIHVHLAAAQDSVEATCSRGVRVTADGLLADVPGLAAGGYDAIVLPGGLAGAKTFAASPRVGALLREGEQAGLLVAAISPIALKAAGVFRGARITSHPSVRSELDAVYAYSEDRVVTDGKLVTSRGPGTTFDFALAIVKAICGAAKMHEIAEPMMLPPSLVQAL